MDLDGLIFALERIPPEDTILCGALDSWRGVYAELTLVPTGRRPAGELLAEARRVKAGEIRTGWKGGDYTYSGATPVWADERGECEYNALTGIAVVPDRDARSGAATWRLVTQNIAEYR